MSQISSLRGNNISIGQTSYQKGSNISTGPNIIIRGKVHHHSISHKVTIYQGLLVSTMPNIHN